MPGQINHFGHRLQINYEWICLLISKSIILTVWAKKYDAKYKSVFVEDADQTSYTNRIQVGLLKQNKKYKFIIAVCTRRYILYYIYVVHGYEGKLIIYGISKEKSDTVSNLLLYLPLALIWSSKIFSKNEMSLAYLLS